MGMATNLLHSVLLLLSRRRCESWLELNMVYQAVNLTYCNFNAKVTCEQLVILYLATGAVTHIMLTALTQSAWKRTANHDEIAICGVHTYAQYGFITVLVLIITVA